MNYLIEGEALLRRMDSLKEKNQKLEERYSKLHAIFFGDVEALRSKVREQECLLKEKEGPVISQIQPYKSIEPKFIDLTMKNPNKGKQKVVGIQINESQVLPKPTMSKLDLDLEKAKKE